MESILTMRIRLNSRWMEYIDGLSFYHCLKCYVFYKNLVFWI
jgi:hypothetical protein